MPGAGADCYHARMASRSGPSNTWWARRTTIVNLAIVLALLLFLLWKAVYP